MTTRTFRRGLIAAALVALAVRVAYILVVRRDVLPGGDSFTYHLGARLLVEGHGFIEPQPLINGIIDQSASHPPLYLLYLAIPSAFGLDGPVAHMLWSSLIGVGTVVLVGLTAREVAGPRAGLIAAGLAAFYPNLWIFDGFILSETMAMFMAILSVFLAYRYLRTPTPWRAAALGLACGAAALARAELVLLLPLLVLPCVLITRAIDVRKKVQWLLAAGLAALIPIGPWVTFNMIRFDRPVFLSTGLEPTVVGANCNRTYYTDLIGYFSPDCTENVFVAPRNGGPDQSVRNVRLGRIAREYILDNKARVPVVVLARWGRITGLFRPDQQLQLDEHIEGRERWTALAALLSFYVVAASAITGAVILRRRRVKVFPLIVPCAIALFAVAVALGSNRYRASAEPVLAVLAAVAINAGLSAYQRRRSRPPRTKSEPEAPARPAVGAAAPVDGA
ncbi:MAG TPA: glycosyltransferase family 39 protein, partial [Solirubrobacteraceae bacterium]